MTHVLREECGGDEGVGFVVYEGGVSIGCVNRVFNMMGHHLQWSWIPPIDDTTISKSFVAHYLTHFKHHRGGHPHRRFFRRRKSRARERARARVRARVGCVGGLDG